MRTPSSNSLFVVLAALGALAAACGDDTSATTGTSSSNDGSGGEGEGGSTPSSTGTTTATTTSGTTTTSSSGGQGGQGQGGQGQGGQGGADLCGNGQVDGDEVCDGAELADQTCEGLDFVGGTLGCSADCSAFDTSACETCGDEIVSGSDECDGTDLDGEGCTDQGFDGGTLGCNADCTFDVAQCVDATCEDGILNGDEDCTGSDLGGATCESEGFALGGGLACTDTCQFNTTACLTCGDGIINGDDACDGAELGGATCAAEGFTGGTIGCTACTLDTSGCTNFPQPGVGEVVISEIMNNPSAATEADFEWFEIHNPGGAGLQLAGCVVSSTNDASFTIMGDLGVAPGGYATLARATAPGFTPDYVYPPAFTLANGGTDAVAITCGTNLVDEVAFTTLNGFVVAPNGSSLQLDPASTSAAANDQGASWCAATTASPNFATGDNGTPGLANPVCAAGTSSSSSGTTTVTTGSAGGGSGGGGTGGAGGGEDPVAIGFCKLQAPLTISGDQGTSVEVYGRVFVAGLTDVNTAGNDVSSMLVAEVGFGPDASDPEGPISAWTWVPGAPNAGYGTGSPSFEQNNDEYVGSFQIPGSWGSPYDYAIRFSGDGGLTWTVCDLDGSDDGYEATEAGAMTSALTPGGLFISEYIEGPGENKAIELFNASGAAVGLSACELRNHNAGAAGSADVTLSGTIGAGETFVVCRQNANSTFFNTPGVCDLAVTAATMQFNGDDAVVLACNEIILDVVGQFGAGDTGPWGTAPTDTENVALRRNCDVLSGDAIGSDVFDPSVQWLGANYAVATDPAVLASLGAHLAICAQ